VPQNEMPRLEQTAKAGGRSKFKAGGRSKFKAGG
jgi:hypothetical protein